MAALEEMLTERSNALIELRDTDNEIRQLYATGDWQARDEVRLELERMLTKRHSLARDIRDLGAVAWEYGPEADNSWLVHQPGECGEDRSQPARA